MDLIWLILIIIALFLLYGWLSFMYHRAKAEKAVKEFLEQWHREREALDRIHRDE